MRKEVEVKAQVTYLADVAQKLLKMGCVLSEPAEQNDTVFINFDGPYDKFTPGALFLRIRKTQGKVLFTIKRPLKNELDALEHEVLVSDADEMRSIIGMLGYHQAVQINKTRQKTRHGEYEICLDEVEHLGTFIEVEKITEEEDSEAVQEELFKFLETLGVKRQDRVLQGYDTLLFLQQSA